MHPDNFQTRAPQVGDAVVFHNSRGVAHNALVTVIYSPGYINAAYVSSDESRQDSYGRQIERTATCAHKSLNKFHGNYWRWSDEEPNPVTPPQAQ